MAKQEDKQGCEKEEGNASKGACHCSTDKCGPRCTPCVIVWAVIIILLLLNLFWVF